MGVREQVEHVGPLVPIATLCEQRGVARERHRVATDEHDHGWRGLGDGGDPWLAEPGPRRVGDSDVDRLAPLRLPAAHLRSLHACPPPGEVDARVGDCGSGALDGDHLARLAGRRQPEQSDAGVGVEHRTSARQLGGDLLDGRHEQLRCSGSTLEEGGRRHPESVIGDHLVERRLGADRDMARQSADGAVCRVPQRRHFTCRCRGTQRDLGIGRYHELVEQRDQRWMGDEAAARRHGVVRPLASERRTSVEIADDTNRGSVRIRRNRAGGTHEGVGQLGGTSQARQRRSRSWPAAGRRSRCAASRIPRIRRAGARQGGNTRSAECSTTSTTCPRDQSPFVSVISTVTSSPGTPPRTNTIRPSSSRASASPPATNRSGRTRSIELTLPTASSGQCRTVRQLRERRSTSDDETLVETWIHD